MPDRISKEKRSRLMSRIRGRRAALEKRVFRRLKMMGLKFKKLFKNAPGTPDIVCRRGRSRYSSTAIFGADIVTVMEIQIEERLLEG